MSKLEYKTVPDFTDPDFSKTAATLQLTMEQFRNLLDDYLLPEMKDDMLVVELKESPPTGKMTIHTVTFGEWEQKGIDSEELKVMKSRGEFPLVFLIPQPDGEHIQELWIGLVFPKPDA